MQELREVVRWALGSHWDKVVPLNTDTYESRGFSIETLWRDPPYQIERVTLTPHCQIVRHRHPNIDSWEVYLKGDGVAYVGHRTFRIDGVTKFPAILIPRGMWHGGKAGEHGGQWLSVQRWHGEMTSVGKDWEEAPPGNIEFRHKILTLQGQMEAMAAAGVFTPGEYPLKHYFVPRDEKYGCHVYAREIAVPKGHIVVTKIHRHAHFVFLLKGKITVATEFGTQTLEAPCTFISEPGVKRAAVVLEDVIWTTVHLVDGGSEEKLAEIEDEIIAKSYAELGMAVSTGELQ